MLYHTYLSLPVIKIAPVAHGREAFPAPQAHLRDPSSPGPMLPDPSTPLV